MNEQENVVSIRDLEFKGQCVVYSKDCRGFLMHQLWSRKVTGEKYVYFHPYIPQQVYYVGQEFHTYKVYKKIEEKEQC